GPVALHLYGALHLSDAEPGGAEVLGARVAASTARETVVGQVRLLDHGGGADRLDAGGGQRPDAANAAAADSPARIDGDRTGCGPEWPECRPGSVHAVVPRDRPLED